MSGLSESPQPVAEKPKERKTHTAESTGIRLNVTISKKKQAERPELVEKYDVENYDLIQGHTFDEKLRALIPRGTPEYLDHGEKYVERITRALYHFKQCALIGPSGTGKSICETEPVFVLMDGRPCLTTVDELFERLARRLPTTIDQDGWETMVLREIDIKILSFDTSSNDISWKRPFALARSVYRGNIIEVTTQRNRTIRATPGHSFISEDNIDEQIKARDIRVGSRIPIIRRIPKVDAVALAEISVQDYVPGTRLLERGVVVAGSRETIQIPAPPVITLDEEFSWFLGFFVAEGYVGKGFASIYNQERKFVERSRVLLSSMGLATSVRRQRGLSELRVFSQAFISMLSLTTLSKRVGKGKGSQARYKKIPDFVFAMSEASKIAFLRGFFDGDGWEEQGTQIAFGTSSKDLANGLVILCEQLGIFPTIRKKQSTTSFSIVIARDGANKLGIEISGFQSGSDNRGHVEKIRITPELISIARRAYSKLPLELRSRRRWKNLLGNLKTDRMIGLRTLLRLSEDLSSPELRKIAEADVLWDSVKEVKKIPYDGWVYDFQIPGTETFSAGFGGVLTHNTHIVYLVAELSGLPIWEINCGLQTSAYDLFGRYVGLGRENWIDGQIVSWCRYGGILYLDEANMMKQDVATRLNPVLDTRGHLVLTEKDNEIIPRHPVGYVIISMNPYSAEFAGTKPLNAAFRRRLSVWIDFDYLSVGTKIAPDEIGLVEKKAKVSKDTATGIIRVGAELRRQYKANELPYGPSVGDLVNWALLVADGVAPEVA
ncbi:MAG TPA: LAGLIDADG family homing endonuclease, partial [Nitrososphaerales archaeon]|nr:LAGLIDADG family homing endonuclease [Nitrososphaerales archaeon]